MHRLETAAAMAFLQKGLGKPDKLWYTEHTKHRIKAQEIAVTKGSHLVFRCDFFAFFRIGPYLCGKM